MIVDRRNLLSSLGVLAGMSLAAPLAKAVEAGAVAGFEASHPLFTADQRALVGAISECIVPTTDTPGAIAAGVPAFIEMMLVDWYGAGDREEFLAGIAALDAVAHAQHGKPFAAMPTGEQDMVLISAMHGMMPGLPLGFFNHCRQMVILGYYTSEIGCRQERIYVPVPGRYDGAYPYTPGGKVFSS